MATQRDYDIVERRCFDYMTANPDFAVCCFSGWNAERQKAFWVEVMREPSIEMVVKREDKEARSQQEAWYRMLECAE